MSSADQASKKGQVIDDPVAAALYGRAIKNHQPFRDIVAKRSMPNGNRQWIRSSAVPFHDDQGHFAGTTFQLYLPREAERGGQVEYFDSPGAAKANPGETVLVVEDDDDLRSLVVLLLTSLGYQVIDASDGTSAQIKWKSDQRIDVLLTDVVLPGGATGPDIALEARAARPDLKVLFMSGYTADILERHGRPDDAFDIMKKPFMLNELAQRIRETLDS